MINESLGEEEILDPSEEDIVEEDKEDLGEDEDLLSTDAVKEDLDREVSLDDLPV